MIWLRTLAACVLLLAGCATAPKTLPPGTQTPSTLILVSIDGFRADYIGRGLTPTLSALAADGVHATAMRPSFPSVTFPNHYTLVTGLRPDRHGIVNNTMEDAEYPGALFKLSDRVEAIKPHWWDAAAPIWVTAEQHGVKTATMFWPGSEVEIRGTRPHDWAPFDQSLSSGARVAKLLTWLDGPATARPRFMTLYFDLVDTQGHRFGPDSPELAASLRDVDAALAYLREGLRNRGMAESTDLVIVSDHGMSAVSDAQVVDLDTLIDPAKILLPWSSRAIAALTPVPGKTGEVEAALLGRHGAMQCWRKGELPERFHYGKNPRVPPIFCMADPGWMIVSTARPDHYSSAGAHGFDPEDPSMAALFVANGPHFRHGLEIGPFENVNVYPMVMHVLDLAPEPNDGDLKVLAPALRE